MVYPGDSPPMSDKDGSSNKMERTKKKVEWSSNLSSIESFAPEDRSPNWDSETDHLLSYFLGGEQQNNGVTTSPLTQFATTPAPTVNGNPTMVLLSRPGNSHPYASGVRLGQPGFPGGPGRSYAGSYDDDHAPPPTPATQYYHHHASKPKAKGGGRPPTHSSAPKPQPSQSGSSSSGHNMKAGTQGSLQQSTSDQQLESMSPLSPAAMIGVGHEELMLPPPSPQNGQPRPASNPHQPRQSHLEWLQHINALAQQAQVGSNDKSSPMQAQTTQSHHAQSSVNSQPSPIPYPGVPGLPSISAAYGHAPMYYAQAALNQLQHQQTPAPESEEKRAKRLERNRESARKSRRRKKERLSQLEEKVNDLYSQIEVARTIRINFMNEQLQNFFLQRVAQLDSESATGGSMGQDHLAIIFKGAGPNCEVRRAVTDFQYSTLKQTLLPRYQKFLLWLTLHPESWFTAGKEQHTKRELAKQVARVASGKISSKQVGDELTNGSKLEDGTFVPPPQPATPNAHGEKANQTAEAFDGLRMWPLLCFELSISVDQEERILHQAYKSALKRQDLQHCRTQIEAATRMSSRLKEAVLLQSHNVAVREQRTYLEILSPQQSVAMQKWLANNRERCRDSMRRFKSSERAPVPEQVEDARMSENITLIEVCRKLEAVLKISKGERDSPRDMDQA